MNDIGFRNTTAGDAAGAIAKYEAVMAMENLPSGLAAGCRKKIDALRAGKNSGTQKLNYNFR